ncbi:MAG: hypothetical protein RIA62_17475 [Cyclobacteriaceae bacterium]
MYFIVSILYCSCIRVERIEEMNTKPTLAINGIETLMEDSVKISGGNTNYFFELMAIDPDNNLRVVTFEILSGAGDIFQNGIPVNHIQYDQEEILSLRYRPVRSGSHLLQFKIEDSFGQEASATLNLLAFENLLPVSQFELVKPAVQHDPQEYQIDASSSYDPDEKFGGGIVAYEYTFLGKNVELSSSTLGIIFPETGIYDIGIRVKDNDGEWGDLKIRSFQIN